MTRSSRALYAKQTRQANGLPESKDLRVNTPRAEAPTRTFVEGLPVLKEGDARQTLSSAFQSIVGLDAPEASTFGAYPKAGKWKKPAPISGILMALDRLDNTDFVKINFSIGYVKNQGEIDGGTLSFRSTSASCYVSVFGADARMKMELGQITQIQFTNGNKLILMLDGKEGTATITFPWKLDL